MGVYLIGRLHLTASFKEVSAGGGTDQTGGNDDDNQSSVPEF